MADYLSKLKENLAKTGPNLTIATSGGADSAPPALGATRARLVSYIEVGHQKSSFQGQEKIKPTAVLQFELSGPKHPPRVGENGTQYPTLITVKMAIGLHPKNGYFKLFNLLNTISGGGKTHFADLVGLAWAAKVTHRKYTNAAGEEKIAANLREDAWSFSPLTFEDPESGELRTLRAGPQISASRVFVWDFADAGQWESLHIPGTFEDGSSKNRFQNTIREASNFSGSLAEAITLSLSEPSAVAPADSDAAPEADEFDDFEPPAPLPAKAKAAVDPLE
jgi:hypothetical protein